MSYLVVVDGYFIAFVWLDFDYLSGFSFDEIRMKLMRDDLGREDVSSFSAIVEKFTDENEVFLDEEAIAESDLTELRQITKHNSTGRGKSLAVLAECYCVVVVLHLDELFLLGYDTLKDDHQIINY